VYARRESFDFLGNRFVVQPSKRTGAIYPYYYPTPKAMKAVKQKIREVVRRGQHWDLPVLIRERINPILRGWGNYFRTGNSRRHFRHIAKYTNWALCIMLRRNIRSGRRGGETTRRPGFTTTTACSSSTAWWLMQTVCMAAFGNAVMLSAEMAVGRPCAGKPHARFDEGPLRRSLQISGLLYDAQVIHTFGFRGR